MQHYRDQFGSLPPAYTVDGQGNRLHSWRVLLLPFLEHQALYDRIRLDEPWDSPFNQQFHRQAEIQYYFLCPEIRSRRNGYKKIAASDGLCGYSVVVGGETPFPHEKSVKFDDITDGLSQTVLLVETMEPFCWMDPNADVTFGAALDGINKRAGGVGSFHAGDKKSRGGANIACADGAVKFVDDKIDAKVWQAMLTKSEESVKVNTTKKGDR